MTPRLRYIHGKAYRYGYTTGSCAAAAAKAAVGALLYGQFHDVVTIHTPANVDLSIPVHGYQPVGDGYQCRVVKDSGDDPDATNGIEVVALACRNTQHTIIIRAGQGIGVATRKGLSVDVGQPAINPVPMQMIRAEVQQLLRPGEGVTVTISIPAGEEIAKRTFNERLGIVGGISVLGTSGLVIPMSDEAFKEALSLELAMLKAKGVDEVVLTPGNYGERFIKEHIPHGIDKTVTTSNFVGFMLHEAVRHGMRSVTLVGHIGKLVKVAGGIFHTHSSVADARREILGSHYFMYSGDEPGFRLIMESNTTEEAVKYVADKRFFDYLARVIKDKCQEHIHHKLPVEVVLFSLDEGVLGRSREDIT
jgi:cobalt-precorrin-5B (C1)-methyltransferase